MSPVSEKGRIPPERCGEAIEFCRKTPGKNWNMEAVFRREVFEFFLVTFRPVPAKNSSENGYHSPEHGYYFVRKWSEFTRKNPATFRKFPVKIHKQMVIIHRKWSEFTRKNPATFRTFPVKIHKQMVIIHRKWSEFTRKRSAFTTKWSEFTRKKSGDFRPEYCFHIPTFFRCFPSGTGPYYLNWENIPSPSASYNSLVI